MSDVVAVRLAHGVTSPARDERADAAARVTDVVRDLGTHEAAMLTHVLVAARLVEADPGCREQQLYCLSTLAEWHDLPAEAVDRLRALDPATVVGSQVEYLEHLLGSE
ncbi:MAG TPA: hypothetical protein VNU26_04465 [Mycobacteriales bacterium]|nr:hypothetical protein [Mycobacteriales bacterium]